VVVHCAAALSGDLATQEAITVGGTRNLLAGMKEAGVRDIVLIGSFAVYDYQSIAANAQLDENSPLEPNAGARAPYIQVKQQQEALVRSTDSIAWTIVRPGIVFGPGRTWFYHLGAQLPGGIWLCLAPESKFPITHVDNCAEAIVLAAENRNARGTIINLVDDNLPRRGDYIAELLRNQPSKPRTLNLSWSALASMARIASLAGERAPDLLKPGSLSARCKPLQYSNTRAKTVLGWSPRLDWRTALASAVKVHA
jgi:nucleoside-diphosphate-sugar epimerase